MFTLSGIIEILKYAFMEIASELCKLCKGRRHETERHKKKAWKKYLDLRYRTLLVLHDSYIICISKG